MRTHGRAPDFPSPVAFGDTLSRKRERGEDPGVDAKPQNPSSFPTTVV